MIHEIYKCPSNSSNILTHVRSIACLVNTSSLIIASLPLKTQSDIISLLGGWRLLHELAVLVEFYTNHDHEDVTHNCYSGHEIHSLYTEVK